jgi:Protein of unknown function (DUF732)
MSQRFTLRVPTLQEQTMIRHCRTTAVAMVLAGFAVAGFAVFGFAASAHAQPNDQQFIDEVNALGIPVGPNDDVPLMGQRVCEMLTGGLTGNPNPVPVVRGVVSRLQSSGMDKHQAVGLMRASVFIYCPQHGRFMGR